MSFTYNPEKTWQNEPDPEFDSPNPFVNARNHNGWKQIDVAGALKIPALKVMRIEQGAIDVVAAPIVKWYQENLGLKANWADEYQHFRWMMRTVAPRPLLGKAEFPRGEANFRRWRAYNWPQLSQVHWAKAFCVHPADVWKMEQPNWNRVVSRDIAVALVEAGIYTERQIEDFRRIMKDGHQ